MGGLYSGPPASETTGMLLRNLDQAAILGKSYIYTPILVA